MIEQSRRLYRNKLDGKIAGICAGIGDYFDVDPTIIRIAVFFGTLLSGFIVLVPVYIVLIWIIPVLSSENYEAALIEAKAAAVNEKEKGIFR